MKITPRIRKINRYYASRVYPDRAGFEILSWSSREAQIERFKILLELLKRHFAGGACPTLLDVGCGLAELAGYLEKAGFLVLYTGVDLTAEILQEAQQRCPSLNLRQLNIFQDSCPFPEQSFDVVFASGIFNMELGNNEMFAVSGMLRLAALARHLAVANFLHYRSLLQHSICHYYNPDELRLKLCEKSLPVIVHEQYLDNDFTLEFRRDRVRV
ncbi:MAG: class I SAM-dependent methyltransferase [Lentisphaeria bacterium]